MKLSDKLRFEIAETSLIASTRNKADDIARTCQGLFDNDSTAEVMADKLCKLLDDINELKDKRDEIYKVFTLADTVKRELTKIRNGK